MSLTEPATQTSPQPDAYVLTAAQLQQHERKYKSTLQGLILVGTILTVVGVAGAILLSPISIFLGALGTVVSGLSLWLTWRIAKEQEKQLTAADNVSQRISDLVIGLNEKNKEIGVLASRIHELVMTFDKNEAVIGRVVKFFYLDDIPASSSSRYTLHRLNLVGDTPNNAHNIPTILPSVAHTPVSEDHVVNVLQKHFRLSNRELLVREYTASKLPTIGKTSGWNITLSSRTIDQELIKNLPAWMDPAVQTADRQQSFQTVWKTSIGNRTHEPEPRAEGAVISDSAIIARLSSDGGKTIVIEGQSQYGTWLAGHYIDGLLEGGVPLEALDQEVRKRILEGVDRRDFIAVIKGSINRDNEFKPIDVPMLVFFAYRHGDRWKQLVPRLAAAA